MRTAGQFHHIIAPGQADAFENAQGTGLVQGKLVRIVQIGIVPVEGIVIKFTLLVVRCHVEPGAADIGTHAVVIGIEEVGEREVLAQDRHVHKHAGTHAHGIGTVHRERVRNALQVSPGSIHNGALDHAAVQGKVHGSEFLPVRVTEFGTDIVVEIRLQVGVTETHAQRIGIVRYRHQL